MQEGCVMFVAFFIITIALFAITSALCIFSIHTEDVSYFKRGRAFFLISVFSFAILGALRFYYLQADSFIRGDTKIWDYFYLLAMLMILILVYLNFSRWKNQWKSFSVLAVPFITLILVISIPFIDSDRKILLNLSHRLFPLRILHMILAITGELVFFFSFVGSVLYIIMEWQLKKKASMRFVNQLPTLESIENFNRWAVARSFILLSFGLLLGILMAFLVFDSPTQGSPKEIILYVSWLILLLLFYLRHRGILSSHIMSRLNAVIFVLLMCIFIFTNVYITRGFHSFR